jgi:hypothetical protein
VGAGDFRDIHFEDVLLRHLFAMDRDICRSGDPEADPIALDGDHADTNVPVDDDLFPNAATEN